MPLEKSLVEAPRRGLWTAWKVLVVLVTGVKTFVPIPVSNIQIGNLYENYSLTYANALITILFW